MTSPVPETVSVPLPGATVRRPNRRGDGWRVTLGRIEGRGPTLTAAKTDLAAQLTATVDALNAAPAFARDGDALVVAIDRPWGIDLFRAIGTTARLLCGVRRHPEGPAGWLAGIPEYDPLRENVSGRTMGAFKPRRYSLTEVTDALAKVRSTAEEYSSNANALDMFTNSTLATLANPLAQYPAPDPSVTEKTDATVTVYAVSNGYISEFSELPGRRFGPWDMVTMIRDLTVSALLSHSAARDLVMDAAVHGAATTNTKH